MYFENRHLYIIALAIIFSLYTVSL